MTREREREGEREERPIPSSPLEPHGREKHDTVLGSRGREGEARR